MHSLLDRVDDDRRSHPATPANRALTTYLGDQIDQILVGVTGLRNGDDPIHDTRVAIRRLRSTFRVFAPVFDETALGSLESDLQWFAGLLGQVRDCQVQRRRLLAAVDELPVALAIGPLKAHIVRDLSMLENPARQQVSDAMETGRYRSLISTLQTWRINGPPLDGDVRDKTLHTRARRAGRKADRRLADAAALDGPDAANQLHRARKAAKRARYAAELLIPIAARKHREVKHYKRIQSTLGDHQGCVVAQRMLREMGVSAGTTQGENGFTYGLLHEREAQSARRCRKVVRKLA